MGVGFQELRPFESAAGEGDTILRAQIERAGTRLSLRYVLAGAVGRQRIPDPQSPPRRADHLWAHTCFEAFLAPVGGSAYWEIDLSPSGDWNMYRFDGYREGMRPETRVQAPTGAVEQATCGTLTFRETVDLGSIPELADAALDVGLAAVLETSDATLSYWALHHATAKPDFHRRESFVVRLDAEHPA
jgi:hypothetical protein